MFGQIAPTEFDLRFSVFGIPVRVHPLFWLIAALMGSNTLQQGPSYLFVWIACVFFSILIHELGHALTAKYFGWPPEVVLYFMGGVAMFRPGVGFTASRSVLISFAGPAAGFMLFGIVIAAWFGLEGGGVVLHPLITDAFWNLCYINLIWGLVNLLPVLPLDGGRICESVCTSLRPRDGELWAIRIGMVFAGGVALLFLSLNQMYPGFLFGYLCFSNFQMYQAYKGRSSW